MSNLLYILKHAPFWWLVFWLRPLEIIWETEKHHREWLELSTAALSGVLWGGVLGVVFYWQTGNVNLLWMMPFAVAGAFAVIAAFTVTFVAAFAIAGAVAVIDSFMGMAGVAAIAIIGVIAGSGIGTSIKDGLDFEIFSGKNIYFFLSAVAGIFVSGFLPISLVKILSIITSTVVMVLGLWLTIIKTNKKKFPDWAALTLSLFWAIGLPFFSFILFFYQISTEIFIFSVIFFISIGFGFISGFFNEQKENLLQNYKNKQKLLSFGLWIICSIFALLAWLPNLKSPSLDEKLDILAISLISIPVIMTGLPFYPINVFINWYQSNQFYLKKNNTKNLLPLRWQTFSYPMPGYQRLFKNITELQGVKSSVELIQKLQINCLQEQTIAQAVCKLANDPAYALPLCGTIATLSNSATTAPLALAGEPAQAIGVLAAEVEKENKQPLLILIGTYPPRPSRFNFKLLQRQTDDQPISPLQHYQDTRRQALPQRLNFALNRLEKNLNYTQTQQFKEILLFLNDCAQAPSLNYLEAIRIRTLNLNPQIPAENGEWLEQGWKLLPYLQKILTELEPYRNYDTAESRRGLLEHVSQQIKQSLADENHWQGIPNYWANIGKEIYQIWLEVIETASQQAKELLNISIDIPDNQIFRAGDNTLTLHLNNQSGIPAKNLKLSLDSTENLHYTACQHDLTALDAHYQKTLNLDFTCDTPADYNISGQLYAEALDGSPLHVPFTGRLHIGHRAKDYQIPTANLYIAGEGVDDEQHFIGRQRLLHKLRAHWQQKDSKPAILLLGQRRIGKTSLLNKLQRMGLEDCQLLPVKIDAQSWENEQQFFTDLSQQIANKLGCTMPSLNDPRSDFKTFITQHAPLNNQRVLLMIDETEELFSEQKHYGTLAGHLRSIMQGHDYPVLLLFCGAHKLKAIASNRDSVFFNTVIEHTVSYMSEEESKQVLTQPANGWLDFDALALKTAYQLTHGQPYLLQQLGQTVIDQFNEAVWDGEQPSNYVDNNDIQRAADALAKQGSNAFLQHWADQNDDTRRLLSAFAASVDDYNRARLDIDQLEQACIDQQLPLTRKIIFDTVQRLTDEEILLRTEVGYRFAVPLYRRWIAWRWSPQVMKEAQG